jgi:hypothetical protein
MAIKFLLLGHYFKVHVLGFWEVQLQSHDYICSHIFHLGLVVQMSVSLILG